MSLHQEARFSKSNNSLIQCKLIAKGFAQKECIDYNEVFSPVVQRTSIRILLALVAEYELDLDQLDVKMAFLHGELEEEIYMTQPYGFKVARKENHMCRLIKSLYGLKQSPRQQYKRFDQFIEWQKFIRSEHDHCVHFRRLQDGVFIYLLLYVDNILIASKNKAEIERLKKQLASEFEMKNLEEYDYMARVPYASVVGSFMYAIVCTRPDISQAVIDVGLLFKKNYGQQCVKYCDSDFARNLNKRRSTTGYVFTLGGGSVSWRSILQSKIALSTTEAEYMATTEVVKEVI
ncbi:hypothetical protein KPL71_023401 [Citrus sinensis]|uniref:Uncharacterized protein n=1 Tax=Citrus sinensis TaxID=2711 RepID=A0ACB8IIE2_CITSI|nr:hypothetical protein KPL71_023401 [Citrus sinensis]